MAKNNRRDRDQGMQEKVNVNNASKDELAKVQGIGNNRAEKIVQYREENGAFSDLNEIDKVPGMQGNISKKTKDRLTV